MRGYLEGLVLQYNNRFGIYMLVFHRYHRHFALSFIIEHKNEYLRLKELIAIFYKNLGFLLL